MKIEQRSTIRAPREAVWKVLEDVPRAARCIPGVRDVVAMGEDRYRGIMEVRVGPMALNLQGELKARADPGQYQWHLEGEARDRRLGGGLRIIVDAALQELAPGQTELQVSTDLQFMGGLGTLGQPLIKARANAQMREFAVNLAKEVGASR